MTAFTRLAAVVVMSAMVGGAAAVDPNAASDAASSGASGPAFGPVQAGRAVTARPRTPAMPQPARFAGASPAVGAGVLRSRR